MLRGSFSRDLCCFPSAGSAPVWAELMGATTRTTVCPRNLLVSSSSTNNSWGMPPVPSPTLAASRSRRVLHCQRASPWTTSSCLRHSTRSTRRPSWTWWLICSFLSLKPCGKPSGGTPVRIRISGESDKAKTHFIAWYLKHLKIERILIKFQYRWVSARKT